MSNFTKINAEQICSVKSYIGYRSTEYEYRESKKRFLRSPTKEGYYYTGYHGERFMTVEEIEKDTTLFCKDNKVNVKPHIEITMSNQNYRVIYFETEQELNHFMEQDLMKMVNWIDVSEKNK